MSSKVWLTLFFLLAVAIAALLVYGLIVFWEAPELAHDRFGELEPLPQDLGKWRLDDSSPAGRQAAERGLERQERLLYEEAGIFGGGTLVRQVRLRDPNTHEILFVEPEERRRRRRLEPGATRHPAASGATTGLRQQPDGSSFRTASRSEPRAAASSVAFAGEGSRRRQISTSRASRSPAGQGEACSRNAAWLQVRGLTLARVGVNQPATGSASWPGRAPAAPIPRESRAASAPSPALSELLAVAAQ